MNKAITTTHKTKESEYERLVYTVPEVAKLLHSSPNYIYSLIEKGKLPAIKLGSLKILKSSLEKFLTDNEGKDLSNIIENISNKEKILDGIS